MACRNQSHALIINLGCLEHQILNAIEISHSMQNLLYFVARVVFANTHKVN